MSTWLAAVCLVWLMVAPVEAASVHPEAGVLLVAREDLPDPRFHQAVVLLLQHGPQGTVGLIINRPTRLGLVETFPDLAALAAAENLSYGGPVAPRALMVLVKSEGQPPEPSQRLFGDVYLTGPEPLAAWLGEAQPDVICRMFAGYAGWAPGQLADELARGDWRTLKATEQLVFTADPGGLWPSLFGREAAPSTD